MLSGLVVVVVDENITLSRSIVVCGLQMWYKRDAPTKTPPSPALPAAESGVDVNGRLLALCKKNKAKGEQQERWKTDQLFLGFSLINFTVKKGVCIKK